MQVKHSQHLELTNKQHLYRRNIELKKKSYITASGVTKQLNESVNNNILPFLKSPIERRLNLAKLTKTYIKNNIKKNKISSSKVLDKKSINQSMRIRSSLDAKDNLLGKKRYYIFKPLFIIPTKDTKSMNKKSFIGRLIDSIQSRLPPIPCGANCDDSTSFSPPPRQIDPTQSFTLTKILESKGGNQINLSVTFKKKSLSNAINE